MTNLNYITYTIHYSMRQYLSVMFRLTLLSLIFNITIHIISITLLLRSAEQHCGGRRMENKGADQVLVTLAD